MRPLALLLVLAAAPHLGGCTLALGTTGAIIDTVSTQKPAARYTLDAPPPYNTPVEILTRSGGDMGGTWQGTEEATLTTSTPTTPATVRRMIVLHGANGQRLTVAAEHVARIRGLPVRRNTALSMMLIGLVIDGVLVKAFINSFECEGECG